MIRTAVLIVVHTSAYFLFRTERTVVIDTAIGNCRTRTGVVYAYRAEHAAVKIGRSVRVSLFSRERRGIFKVDIAYRRAESIVRKTAADFYVYCFVTSPQNVSRSVLEHRACAVPLIAVGQIEHFLRGIAFVAAELSDIVEMIDDDRRTATVDHRTVEISCALSGICYLIAVIVVRLESVL